MMTDVGREGTCVVESSPLGVDGESKTLDLRAPERGVMFPLRLGELATTGVTRG